MMKYPTPSLKHLTKEDYNYVYEPAEDTFLMLDALEMDLSIEDCGSPSHISVLEIGCGTGVSLCQMGKILCHRKTVFLTATDINPLALKATMGTIKNNLHDASNTIELLQMDLINGFVMKNQFDIIIFNPPYVPTLTPHPSSSIEATWAGGQNGRYWIDLLLPKIDKLLSEGLYSRFYMIALQNGNNIPELFKFSSFLSLKHEIVIERRCGIEKLCVIKFSRK